MTTRRTVRSAALAAVVAAAALSLTGFQSGGASGADRDGAGVRTVAAHHVTASTASTASSASARKASPVRTQKLADGSKAEIYELGAQHYLAKIISRGDVLATLETNDRDAGLDANDMFVVLTLDGQVHSWMGGGHQGPGTFKLAGGWTAKVTKVGELRYRAQILGHGGAVYGTLEANEQDAGVDANGVYIVLSAGGVISAHM
ncbi:hypothetical protein NX794_21195 [Streptomyces sp. LP11]|uniref:Lipoprotein n=2 Tax=Streptomyces pyxinicus TaxID=2970331 RepID=A0ABT2B5D6_9ACTN|nr:hypothetical protein [Streptomyces sp. LP11]MCS0603711.1 hypothetical protein [Streptomyces sp. LP11]